MTSRLRRHLAAAAAGTSIGALYHYSRGDEKSGGSSTAFAPTFDAPRLPPKCPPHLVTDAELAISAQPESSSLSGFDGLWLAWYNGPSVLRLTGSPTTLHARHLTGSFALPAGSEAFEARSEKVHDASGASSTELRGGHFGSLVPYGLWPSTAPCRLNLYYTDGSRRAVSTESLSLDVAVGLSVPPFSWLPPVRVPLKRIPDSACILTDDRGHVRAGTPGIEAAQAAVAQAAFEESLLGS